MPQHHPSLRPQSLCYIHIAAIGHQPLGILLVELLQITHPHVRTADYLDSVQMELISIAHGGAAAQGHQLVTGLHRLFDADGTLGCDFIQQYAIMQFVVELLQIWISRRAIDVERPTQGIQRQSIPCLAKLAVAIQ